MKAIQNPQVRRELLFTKLYLEAFPKVAVFIGKRGGTLEVAKDLFQEALIIYYEQVVLEDKLLRQNATAYLLGTVRHLWYQHQNGDSLLQPLDGMDQNLAEDYPTPASAKLKLIQVLETAGKKCMDLLRAFYYEQAPLDEIAEQFGFSTVRSATVQKYKCLEKVRTQVKEKELTYADFTE